MVKTRTTRLQIEESCENESLIRDTDSGNEPENQQVSRLAYCRRGADSEPKELMDLVGGPAVFEKLMKCVQSHTECESNFKSFRSLFQTSEKDYIIEKLKQNVYFYENFLATRPTRNECRGENILFMHYAVQKFIRGTDRLDLKKIL